MEISKGIDARFFQRISLRGQELLRRSPGQAAIVFAAGVLLWISSRVLTPYMAAASLSYTCLVAGLCLRKKRAIHMPLMAAGIALDLAIVLTLEVNRHAVKTAMAFTLSPLQQLHIGCSTIATVLYVPIVILGVRRYLGKGREASSSTHRKLGIYAFVFRTLGFLLMFSLLWKSP